MSEVVRRELPVATGEFYGSAFCCHGRLCKRAAFDQATREADALAQHLGPGWEPRVFENLGWHYNVTLEADAHLLEVVPNIKGSATQGGWIVTGYSAHFDHNSWNDAPTAEEAVIAVIAEMRAVMDGLGAVIAKTGRAGMLAAPADGGEA